MTPEQRKEKIRKIVAETLSETSENAAKRLEKEFNGEKFVVRSFEKEEKILDIATQTEYFFSKDLLVKEA